MSALRFYGPLAELSPADRVLLLERGLPKDPALSSQVAALIGEVRADGDAALRRLARRFDGVALESLEVPRRELERALDALSSEMRRALERAARNLEAVARASLPPLLEIEVEPGVSVGRRADPFERVGVYAPGGTAAYPSSVLMGVVPARTAGVGEILVCSPPMSSGRPSDAVLAAAQLGGATRVFALGGAGAVAALAYGTGSVPRVDRIVGPGNAWVTEAKRQVAGEVGIDSPAGPSEILVIGDSRAPAEAIARELLAQAEHDPDACVVALTEGRSLAEAVRTALEVGVDQQPRAATIRAALAARGAVLWLERLDQAWPFVEAFAPEHLQLSVSDPSAALARVRNAGTVFLGASSSVTFGDYLTGANHVLPTAGAARRFSGLSVLDFLRFQTWQRVTPHAAASLGADAVVLATGEGLWAHANAAAAIGGTPAQEEPRRARLRPSLAPIARHVSTGPPCEIDLSDNTNLAGMPPAVARLLSEAPSSATTRYPSPYADALRAVLAQRHGVTPASIVTGCGSDDVLDAAFRAFGEPGASLAYCPPTFSIIPSQARANGLRPLPLPLTLTALRAADPALIYLCAPNNPTGALLPEGFVETLLEGTRGVLVLDEAYIDYADSISLVGAAPGLERLLVVRTLSKAWGLAGLRVGYAVGAPSLISELEKTRGPYKVGGLAEQAAVAVLAGDGPWVQREIAAVRAGRAAFIQALRIRGFDPLPSQANFVLVPVPKVAEAVAARMRERGVSVRAFSRLEGIGEALRISIGPAPWMRACLTALEEAVQ